MCVKTWWEAVGRHLAYGTLAGQQFPLRRWPQWFPMGLHVRFPEVSALKNPDAWTRLQRN